MIVYELVAGEEPYPGMLAVQIILQVRLGVPVGWLMGVARGLQLQFGAAGMGWPPWVWAEASLTWQGSSEGQRHAPC